MTAHREAPVIEIEARVKEEVVVRKEADQRTDAGERRRKYRISVFRWRGGGQAIATAAAEVYKTHPAIRRACETYIGVHAAEVAKEIDAAKGLYAPRATWTAESLAFYTQAVLQDAFVLAKAKNCLEVARDCVAHLRRSLE